MSTRLPERTLFERSQSVKVVRVYLRQSKEEQFQKESIAVQRAECARLAMTLGLASSWAKRVEYVDVDRAGDDFAGREELTRLLREAAPGDTVLAWKQDRVGRDMIDAAATIRELVKYRQCLLYTAETGSVPVSLDSAEQTAMVMFRGMVAQGELERIRSRTRDGLRQRARDGFAAGPVPFGYRTELVDPTVKNPKLSKKRIVIDEPQAAVVRRIFSEYLEGRGYAAIARGLNRDSVPAPRSNGWAPSGVWEVLRKPVYMGEWTHGQRKMMGRRGNRQIVARAPEKDIIRSMRPELAIISGDVWEQTKTRIDERKVDMKTQCATARHALSGKLRCDGCGGAMRIKTCHGRRADWKKRYYVCGDRLRRGRCSVSTHIPADDAEAKVSQEFQTTVIDRLADKVRAQIKESIERAAELSKKQATEIADLTTELDALRRERQRLVRVATTTDDEVPEIVEALNLNQSRTKATERALQIAKRPPIDPEQAARLEAAAVDNLEQMRKRIEAGQLREALASLCPRGLRFKIQNGLWLIEGAASVPLVRNADVLSERRTTSPPTS